MIEENWEELKNLGSHAFQLHSCYIDSDEFIKESGFMGEVIRATLMRDMGYDNPMSKFIDAIVGIDARDGERYANFNSDDLIKLLGKKDDEK